MLKKTPKVGDRVMLTTLRIKGTIVHMDQPTLYDHHLYPIQLELDKPWSPVDQTKQRMYRTNLLELRELRKRKGRKS